MIRSLKPYPAMKDSGVPWLGKVPRQWALWPVRQCYCEKKTPNVGLAEKTVLSLSYGQIVVKPSDKLHGLVPASFETYQVIDPGDIVIRPTDLQNDHTSLRFGKARNRGIITSAYMCFETQNGLSGDYGFLLLHTYDLNKVFYGLGSGLRQNLDWSDFKYLPCLVPPLHEQSAIVRFLDHVDRKIRKYIRAKLKLIKLLEEQKQAIIHRAVTGQVDVRTGKPYSAYKPSGVEWLGDVPEHWEVLPARALFTEIKQRGHEGETMLSVTIERGVIPQAELLENSIKRDSSNEDKSKYKLLCPGDIGYNKMRAWQGAFGATAHRGIVSPAYIVVRPTPLADSIYYHLLFRTPVFAKVAERWSYGIASDMWSLRPEHFRLIRVPVPPREEQGSIAKRLSADVETFDTSISRLGREISLLREYRTRLIADVVTGKLDVREAAANLPEEAEEPEVAEATENAGLQQAAEDAGTYDPGGEDEAE